MDNGKSFIASEYPRGSWWRYWWVYFFHRNLNESAIEEVEIEIKR